MDKEGIEFTIEDPYGVVETIYISPAGEVSLPIVEAFKKIEEERERLRQKIARYEAPLPLGKGHCDHRFTDEGICIRCGEDAEEWDAGCVEEIVEDLQSITTREFLAALEQVVAHRHGGSIDVIVIYMRKIREFVEAWEQIERWKERSGGMDVADGADKRDSDDSADFTLTG